MCCTCRQNWLVIMSRKKQKMFLFNNCGKRFFYSWQIKIPLHIIMISYFCSHLGSDKYIAHVESDTSQLLWRKHTKCSCDTFKLPLSANFTVHIFVEHAELFRPTNLSQSPEQLGLSYCQMPPWRHLTLLVCLESRVYPSSQVYVAFSPTL